jgi:hypothetical protein
MPQEAVARIALRRAYPNLALHIRQAMLDLVIPMTPQRLKYVNLYCMVRIMEGPKRYSSAAQRRACPHDVAIMIGTMMSDWLAEYRDEAQHPDTELSWHIIALSDKVRRYSNWHMADEAPASP